MLNFKSAGVLALCTLALSACADPNKPPTPRQAISYSDVGRINRGMSAYKSVFLMDKCKTFFAWKPGMAEEAPKTYERIAATYPYDFPSVKTRFEMEFAANGCKHYVDDYDGKAGTFAKLHISSSYQTYIDLKQ